MTITRKELKEALGTSFVITNIPEASPARENAIEANRKIKIEKTIIKALINGDIDQINAVLPDDCYMGKWLPISGAPKDGTLIKVYSKKGFAWEGWPSSTVDTHVNYLNVRWGKTSVYAHSAKRYNGKGDGFILDGSDQDGEYNIYTEVTGATHWTPIPASPKEKK